MERTKAAALAITAIVAASAVTAATALAFPEFKPSTKQRFKSPGATFSTTGESLTCASDSNVGEITGATSIGQVVLTFKGCTGKSGSSECSVNSTGASTGEIVTKTIKGELGEVAKSEAESGTGVLLEPETNKEFATIEGSCITTTAVSGTVAGEAPQTGRTSKFGYLAFEKNRIKTITLKSGSKKPKLEAFGNTVTFEGANGIELAETAIEIT